MLSGPASAPPRFSLRPTAGALKDIINAPSTASFEGSSGEMLAAGVIDLMMKTKPDSLALKDYQASSAGRRFIEAMAYVRAYPIDLPSLRAALPGIRTPVLSIWGAHDPIVPPENADVLGRALPRMRSVLLDSGHFVWGGPCGRLRGGDPGLESGRLQRRPSTAYADDRASPNVRLISEQLTRPMARFRQTAPDSFA